MITTETLDNGLRVIVEEIPHLQSAAYDLLIPAGILNDSQDRIGASLLLGELITRGAGDLSSRELSESFEQFGIRHSESGSSSRFSFRGSLLADKLSEALRLVSLMVKEPKLPNEELGNIKASFLQDLQALQDNPSRRAMMHLTQSYYPDPFGRPSIGTEDGITQTSSDPTSPLQSSSRPIRIGSDSPSYSHQLITR